MNPGKLDRRITILNPIGETENEMEEIVLGLEEVATVWASVEALRGREYLEAQKIRAEVTYRVIIRYRNDIKPTMRIKFDNRELEIQSVIEIGRKKYLELMCIEKVK